MQINILAGVRKTKAMFVEGKFDPFSQFSFGTSEIGVIHPGAHHKIDGTRTEFIDCDKWGRLLEHVFLRLDNAEQ